MKRLVKILLSLPFILAAGAIALYALAGFIAAPWYIKRALPDYLRENLNATGSVGEVRVNPFIFTLEARDFALTESGGKTPAIAVERLFVDFELSSLFRRAWTFAAITVERPRVNLEIDAKDTLNLSKLAPAKEAEAAAALPRLLLQHLEIKQGSAAVTDLGIPGKASTRLEPIEFQLRDLSTLPDHSGDYTLTAKLPAGGSLGWRGSLKLAPIASTGRVELRDLKLATVWSFLQDKLLIESPAGSVDLSFGYNTRYTENKLDATADSLAAKLSGLELKQRGQQEVALRIGDAALRGGTFNLGSRSVRFAEFAANKLFAHTIIDESGSVNWGKLVVPGPDTPAGAPWQITIDTVSVSEVTLRTDDHGFEKPLTFDVERAGLKAAVKIATGASPSVVVDGLAVDLNGILAREAGTKEALVTLGTMNFAGGSFDLAQHKLRFTELALAKGHANYSVDPTRRAIWRRRAADVLKPIPVDEKSAVPWQIAIDVLSASEFSLQALDQSYTRPLAFEITRAAARAGVNIEIGTALKLDVDALAVDLNDVRVAEAGAKEILVSLGTANLSGGKFSLALNRFSADTLKLTKANAQLIRDAAGGINLASAFTPKTAPAPSNTKPVAVEIRALELNDGAIALLDRGIEPALTVDLQSIRILARGVNSAGTQPMTLDATLRIKQGGTMRAQGSVTTARQRASLRIETRDIALAPLEALVAKHTTLKLKSGTASSSGQIEWNGAGKSTDLRYTGSATIDALQFDEETSGERFSAWKQMLAEDMNIDFASHSARIGDLRLNAPAGKIIIAKDRSTNLSGIMRKSGTTPTTTPTPPPATSTETFVVNVERVHVANGELDFADYSLVLPFATMIREMNGNITGLSTQSGTRAGVKLEGRVDEFGQAQVSGSINPFEPKVFTDLLVSFRNVALSPLTPYSATFAGRRIASGKLSLDLQYKIINSQLLGENKVLLEQFTLGERVESPTAVSLPLDLAIALLTDSSGKIDLSVPVRGNVDAPEFSYSHIVWQAIRTVITNIVTAPFRALASLFGGSAEKVDAIAFDAGRAQLAPPEREKLSKITGVLKQRPNLKLMVQGRYDSRYDGAALRTQATHRLLAERMGIKLAGPDDSALPNYDNAKTQRAIEALYEERAGSGSVDKFKVEYEKKTGKEVKRVNAALALIGRGSADREFYESLLSRAAELHTLTEAQLQALATQRGNVIVEHLKTASGLDATRFAAGTIAKFDADKASEITSALTLAPLK
jgi:hypothetical protein